MYTFYPFLFELRIKLTHLELLIGKIFYWQEFLFSFQKNYYKKSQEIINYFSLERKVA